MIVGYIIIGMLLGTISAATSLFLGSSVLWALGIYFAVGNISVFLSAAIVYVRSRFLEDNDENMILSDIN